MDAFDVVVIGGGNGGYTAAIRAAQLGLCAAIVEQEKIGGTCLHRGCIPTKLLLEAAEVLALARRGDRLGVRTHGAELDYAALLARREQVVEALHRNLRSLIGKHGVEVIQGRGRLLSPTRVEVDGGAHTLEAGHIVLAPGCRPRELPGLPFDGQRILSSDHALALPRLPRSIAIVGAGSIGVEFASFYLDAGCEVTLIEVMPTLLPLEDADLGKALARALAGRGANVLTSARLLPERSGPIGEGVELTVEHEDVEKTVRADVALVAVGREGATQGLGLENTRVRLEQGFICVDARYRTDEPTIYAVGDAIGGLQLAHLAAAEGLLAAEALAGREPPPLDYRRVPRVTYSRPQVAAVGMTEEEARQASRAVRTRRFSFRNNAMALIQDESEGFVKTVFDGDSGELLGVHIIGPRASELIGEAALARHLGASIGDLAGNIHPHPTLSEVLGEAAQLSAGVSIYW